MDVERPVVTKDVVVREVVVESGGPKRYSTTIKIHRDPTPFPCPSQQLCKSYDLHSLKCG